MRFLLEAGLRPLARNFRTRCGEIDLVMLDGKCVVFVEVRYRRNRGYSSAVETVDARKRRRLVRAARLFLASRLSLAHCPARFDIVAYDLSDDGQCRRTWLRNAFPAED